MRKGSILRMLSAVLLGLLLLSAAQAADYYQNATMPSTGNPDWLASTTYWSSGAAPVSPNSYWVGSMPDGMSIPGYPAGSRIDCRTVNSAASAFPTGAQLVINTSGTLLLRCATGQTVTVPNMLTRGIAPRINCDVNGATQILAGNVILSATLTSYTNFRVNATGNDRVIQIDAKLTGPGQIRAEGSNSGGRNHAIILNNDTNDFTGRIFTNNDAKILVNQPHGLGNATTITVANQGTLNPNVSIDQSMSNLIVNAGGMLITDVPSLRFKTFRLPGGAQVRKGTYATSALAALYPGSITDAAGGTLEVTTGLPEIASDVTTVTFGTVNVEFQHPTMNIVISNPGGQPLTFIDQTTQTQRGVAILGTHASLFSIQSITPSTATPLPAGGSMTVAVKFNGTMADWIDGGDNNKSAYVRFYTDAVNSGTFDVPLTAVTVPVEMSTFSVE